ncbi:MAG: hypothetical protein K5665_04190 [Saccharofermentans sp.]|nr:hypothetical protein [Saccharofermentans sp.]
MKKDKQLQRIIVIMTVIISILFTGCSVRLEENNTTNSSLSIVECGQTLAEIDSNNYTFTIKYEDGEEKQYLEGVMFTQECPKTANVYKVISFDEDLFENPINLWKRVLFQSERLLDGQFETDVDSSKQVQLSRSEREDVIKSTTRIISSDFEQASVIQNSFSDVVFSDYMVKITFPAISTSLYTITSYDTDLDKEIYVDTIKNRALNLYVTRQSIGGINVGIPSTLNGRYEDYDDKNKMETLIFDSANKMFYDGIDIYEVHTNDKKMEPYLNDQPIISFEQAMEKALPDISLIISDSTDKEKELHIYAAELAYLTIVLSDMSNGQTRDTNNMFFYPFWVIYVQSNYLCVGEDIAENKPVLVNAITGDVYVCK